MMQGIREFLDSAAGKVVAVVVMLVALAAAAYSVKANLGQSNAAALSTNRMYVDSVTGKPFSHELAIGDTNPITAPSGGKTGYLAEPCYWTKDGSTKSDPTWVLMNESINKPGPTFCPDCGRLVVGRNPMPTPGAKPPPTAAEYALHPVPAKETN